MRNSLNIGYVPIVPAYPSRKVVYRTAAPVKHEEILSLEELQKVHITIKETEIRVQQRIDALLKLPETLLKMSHEDWCSVFSALRPSTKDLLNCRLVCKKWNDSILKYHKILCVSSENYNRGLKTLAVEDTFPLHVRASTNQMFIFFTLIPFAEWYARDVVAECLKRYEFKFAGPKNSSGVYVAKTQITLASELTASQANPCFDIEIACDFNFNFKELTVGFGQLELSMLRGFTFSYSFPNSCAIVRFSVQTEK